MSDEEEVQVAASNSKGDGGQVTLAQMLKVLDKDVAIGVEKRLKKLSKKKAFKSVVNEKELEQANRRVAYDETIQEVNKWEPIVELNRTAKLSFPLDVQPDILPTGAESLSGLKPRNELEKEVQLIIEESMAEQAKEADKKKAEERYQKAISTEEAKERHLELQKTRVRLNEFGAKMRRQNKIKSKSYHRLLKQERIKKHLKRVESNQDALMDEIERLQKIRAEERASLKHKNTGKWAKHAKFRAKYDEAARQQMLEQIGIAKKLLERPAVAGSESESEDFGDDNYTSDDTSDESEEDAERAKQSDEENRVNVVVESGKDQAEDDKIIMSSDFIDARFGKKRKLTKDQEAGLVLDDGDGSDASDSESEHEQARQQHELMREAFANDDVVAEFREAKDQVAAEEQPKDVDKYLPGWGDWAGPNIEANEERRKKFVKKAPKVKRKDEALSNVIISEQANSSIKLMQPKKLPRGIRDDKHLGRVLAKPVSSTFMEQTKFREKIQPQVRTRMGARIEPISKRLIIGGGGGSKAGWA